MAKLEARISVTDTTIFKRLLSVMETFITDERVDIKIREHYKAKITRLIIQEGEENE